MVSEYNKMIFKINIIKGVRYKKFRKKEELRFLRETFGRKVGEDYLNGLNKIRRFTLEIKDSERSVGSASIEISGGLLKIEEFILRRDYRGRGIGNKTLQKIENFGKRQGCHKMQLVTNPELRAVKLYKRNGWNIEAILKKNIAKLDEVLMCKYLN